MLKVFEARKYACFAVTSDTVALVHDGHITFRRFFKQGEAERFMLRRLYTTQPHLLTSVAFYCKNSRSKPGVMPLEAVIQKGQCWGGKMKLLPPNLQLALLKTVYANVDHDTGRIKAGKWPVSFPDPDMPSTSGYLQWKTFEPRPKCFSGKGETGAVYASKEAACASLCGPRFTSDIYEFSERLKPAPLYTLIARLPPCIAIERGEGSPKRSAALYEVFHELLCSRLAYERSVYLPPHTVETLATHCDGDDCFLFTISFT